MVAREALFNPCITQLLSHDFVFKPCITVQRPLHSQFQFAETVTAVEDLQLVRFLSVPTTSATTGLSLLTSGDTDGDTELLEFPILASPHTAFHDGVAGLLALSI